MTTFTIDLWFGYNINPDRRGVRYALAMAALKACTIAESMGDDSPPRIVVQGQGWGRDGKSVVLAEFTATERDEVDAASASIANRLGSETQVRRAILRLPQARPKDRPSVTRGKLRAARPPLEGER